MLSRMYVPPYAPNVCSGLAPNREYFDASLKLSHQESVEKCSGHGVYAPRMPNTGAPSPNARKQCMCYAGFTGSRCEGTTTYRPTRACINDCSGRGRCVRNWCHCAPGYYGTDCSLGEARAAADAKALPAPIGAQTGSYAAGAPRVYVYDLPPRYNGWMHAGDGGWWHHLDQSSLQLLLPALAIGVAIGWTGARAPTHFLTHVHVTHTHAHTHARARARADPF